MHVGGICGFFIIFSERNQFIKYAGTCNGDEREAKEKVQ